MKILHITDTYAPVGGAEHYFFDITRELKKRGYDIYTFGFGKPKKTKHDFVYKNAITGFSRYFWRIVPNTKVYTQLRKWIEKINPDIIHLHNINKNTFAVLDACKGFPTIHTVHDYSPIDPFYAFVDKINYPTKRIIQKYSKTKNSILKHLCASIISPSKELQKKLIKKGFKNVVHIPHYIESEKWDVKKSTLNSIMFVGALVKQKGVDALLKSAKAVIKKHPKIKFIIIGNGPEKKALKKLAEREGISKHVIFTGHLSKKQY